MQYTISGELWPGFKSKALRSSTLYNATALYTPLYELVLLFVCNHFMLHAAFSYISYSLKYNLYAVLLREEYISMSILQL